MAKNKKKKDKKVIEKIVSGAVQGATIFGIIYWLGGGFSK